MRFLEAICDKGILVPVGAINENQYLLVHLKISQVADLANEQLSNALRITMMESEEFIGFAFAIVGMKLLRWQITFLKVTRDHAAA